MGTAGTDVSDDKDDDFYNDDGGKRNEDDDYNGTRDNKGMMGHVRSTNTV